MQVMHMQVWSAKEEKERGRQGFRPASAVAVRIPRTEVVTHVVVLAVVAP